LEADRVTQTKSRDLSHDLKPSEVSHDLARDPSHLI
jgi:hypothetical protein